MKKPAKFSNFDGKIRKKIVPHYTGDRGQGELEVTEDTAPGILAAADLLLMDKVKRTVHILN